MNNYSWWHSLQTQLDHFYFVFFFLTWSKKRWLGHVGEKWLSPTRWLRNCLCLWIFFLKSLLQMFPQTMANWKSLSCAFRHVIFQGKIWHNSIMFLTYSASVHHGNDFLWTNDLYIQFNHMSNPIKGAYFHKSLIGVKIS